MSLNKEIFSKSYSPLSLELNYKNNYERRLGDLRFSLIKKHGLNKDVLDLCCGSGSYLKPLMPFFKSAIGVDFSEPLLEEFRRQTSGPGYEALTLKNEDVTCMSLENECVDFVFSIASLYYVPNVEKAVLEVARVLRPGGTAVLELGNLYSINTLVSYLWYKEKNWGKPYHISLPQMHSAIKKSGLEILETFSMQFLPLYRPPNSLFFLYPFLASHWKHVLGLRFKGKMLDQWISSAWPIRCFSFRHFFILKKPERKNVLS